VTQITLKKAENGHFSKKIVSLYTSKYLKIYLMTSLMLCGVPPSQTPLENGKFPIFMFGLYHLKNPNG
jgi:hypothetical protein